jgi:hypothetical protein
VEVASFENLVIEALALPIPMQDLDAIALAASEHDNHSRITWLQREAITRQRTQTPDAAAQTGSAGC